MRPTFLIPTFFMLALTTACSSGVVTPGNDGGDASDVSADTIVGDTLTDTPGSDTTRASPCPSTAPSMGSSCAQSGLRCSYGSDPRGYCRVIADCSGSAWSVQPLNCNPQTCPDMTPIQHASCMTGTEVCAFGDGTRCNCAPCPPGGPACRPGPTMWYCFPPPTDPACPRAMPNFGDPCSPDGTMCDYGGCMGGFAMICQGGIWAMNSVACPG
jgi:hypothetical protein